MIALDTLLLPPANRPSGIRYIHDISRLPAIGAEQAGRLQPIVEQFAFRSNDYYLQLINWDDPEDPIRQLIIPREDEVDDASGRLDPSDEAANTVVPGVQHKYPDTVLLLCSQMCGGLCRYCFRKRLFMDGGQREVCVDVSAGLRYIAQHPEVTNVLLTGGDPLILPTPRLIEILAALRDIPHVRIIRIGSKMPAFNPYRILDDKPLRVALRKYSTPYKRIYLMTHFDHPRELTDAAVRAIDEVIRCGVVCCNQCPITRGVNDSAEVLSELFRKLSWIGCPPYYTFQCRPTVGNAPYAVPLVRAFTLFREALRYGSGVARRSRFVMSHCTGKIEVLAIDQRHIYVRYLRAKEAALRGHFLIRQRNDEALWFDDLEPAVDQEAAAIGAAFASPLDDCETGDGVLAS